MVDIYDMDVIPSTDEYIRGLKQLKPQIKEIHLQIFQAQYDYPNHTANATQIAKAAAIPGGCAVVNRNYGGLGHSLCDIMNFKPMLRPDFKHRWWAIWSIGYNTKNYGFLWKMRPKVVTALKQLEWIRSTSLTDETFAAQLAEQVAASTEISAASRQKRLATAPPKPERISVIRSEYCRNPDVIAEILARAGGFCEDCGQPAPFIRNSDGTPYLEVHHIVQLANGGDDTVANALGLCPNCHRKRHYGNTFAAKPPPDIPDSATSCTMP